ncbi:MAG: glycerophosphodiester phosphodiesterase [Clostridia bacterium]|nr:glycerophosphodiester phosphodiesterase [Clostridia bacterium]
MNLKPIKKLIVAGTAVTAVASVVKKKIESEAIKSAYTLPDSFTVTAHSGCNGTKDNTIESLREAINSGAQILELDILDDENGNVLMTHDYESGKEYPSFEEGLRFIKENSDDIKVNVDLKRSSASFAADEIIRSLGMEDRCFFTGVNEKDVPAVASTVSIPYYINIRSSLKEMFDEEYWISVASRINALGGVGINSNFRLITKKGVEICKKNSLLVSVFTPDSETELNYALTLSPDNITTRNPELILSKRRFVK